MLGLIVTSRFSRLNDVSIRLNTPSKQSTQRISLQSLLKEKTQPSFRSVNDFESSDSLKLSVSEFVITTFYENNDGDRARDFIEIFWSKLTPKVLKSAIFRVWDDEHVRHRLQLDVPSDRNLTRNLYHNEQWKHLKGLDILDENIVINPAEYTHFIHLDKTRVFLPTSDIDYLHFKEIAVAFGKLEP
ncbi:unnamed protein product [Caenorhabditis brenneri]